MTEQKRTSLNALHLEYQAKMVDFAGYQMPIQYQDGIIKEHLHTRQKASLFDVSHMLQLTLTGEHVATALEKITPISVLGLKHNQQRYGFFTLENGGILDDFMLTRLADDVFYLVVNAARRNEDLAFLKQYLSGIQIEIIDTALVALQGPKAADVLASFVPEAKAMRFMTSLTATYHDETIRINRCGYTGEDGYEISVPNSVAISFCKDLLASSEVELAGLGARDTLRLEAGLCLYGNDIDESTTPIEADLAWAIQKARRPEGERAGGFLGDSLVLEQMQNGVSRKRVGFMTFNKAPIRAGVVLVDADDNQVGLVTSGGFSPCLEKGIGMAYLDEAAKEAEVFALNRGKKIAIEIKPFPFVPHQYYRGK